jgi:prolyl-tRNA synthetase
MRLSKTFTKTIKDVPADEQAINARLLIRAGLIHKEMAGVYAYLPLGLRVIENLKLIIREEMNSVGADELLMTSLQPKETWETTGRWDDEAVDVWFKTKLKNGTDVGLGWSHEEPLMLLMSKYIKSYRDLPVSVYQFQTKLRNELRAKSGIMRGREFLMKDLYGFSRSQEELDDFYEQVKQAYLRVFERVGIGSYTFLTYASGGAFTEFSHEFQTVTDSGEDTIYLDEHKKLAVNEEVYSDEVLAKLNLSKDKLKKVKSSEVGNIFNFSNLKGEQMGVYFADEDGSRKPVYLSSYGIGVSRLMGVIAEHFHDERGLIWPEQIAPAQVYLIAIGEEAVIKLADELYSVLTDRGVAVIYDDRDVRPGEKFADADLMGIPYRVVVNSESVTNEQLEIKRRDNPSQEYLTKDTLIERLLGRAGKDA